MPRADWILLDWSFDDLCAKSMKFCTDWLNAVRAAKLSREQERGSTMGHMQIAMERWLGRAESIRKRSNEEELPLQKRNKSVR